MFKRMLATSIAAVVFGLVPGLATATQPATIQLTCSGGTVGTCNVSAQGGGYAAGSATSFHWTGTDIVIAPTGMSATYQCPTATTTGVIKAYPGVDSSGREPLSASVYIQCAATSGS